MAPQTTWSALSASAARGELLLDAAGEREVLDACAELEAELNRIVADLRELGRIGSFGDLPSGIHFGNRFQQKLFEGGDSVNGRVRQMIAEAIKMRQTFERSFANFRNRDKAFGATLNQTGKPLHK